MTLRFTEGLRQVPEDRVRESVARQRKPGKLADAGITHALGGGNLDADVDVKRL